AVAGLLLFNLNNPRLRLRSVVTVAWLAAGGIVAAGAVYSVASGYYRNLAGSSATEAMATTVRVGAQMLATRGMMGQALPLYHTFRIVPHDYDYFGGRTLSNPRGMLPYRNVPWTYLLYDSYNEPTPGVQGGDPTVFFGEVYANWGLPGAFLAMFLFGVIVQLLNHALARNIERVGSVFDVAFFYLVALYVGDFALGFSTIYF